MRLVTRLFASARNVLVQKIRCRSRKSVACLPDGCSAALRISRCRPCDKHIRKIGPFAMRDRCFRQESRSTGVDAFRSRSIPSASDNSATAPSTEPARCDPFGDQRRVLPTASRISSRKVWSAAARDRSRQARARAAFAGFAAPSSITSSESVSSSCRLCRVVQHLEARADSGLERELMQKPRAEGVDGLHLQPAGRLQREREEPPRALRALRRRAQRRYRAIASSSAASSMRSIARACRIRASPCWRQRPW